MERKELAEKLEIIGELFEIDGMAKLVNKFGKGSNIIKFNSIVVQIEGLLLKTNPELAIKIICMNGQYTEEEAKAMEDTPFALALRDAIITDVIGFFGSSPHTDGKK